MAGRWFSQDTRVTSTKKSDHHDITEILLKVVLNTINQIKPKMQQTIQIWLNQNLYINDRSVINRLSLISRWVIQTQLYLLFILRKIKKVFSSEMGGCLQCLKSSTLVGLCVAHLFSFGVLYFLFVFVLCLVSIT